MRAFMRTGLRTRAQLHRWALLATSVFLSACSAGISQHGVTRYEAIPPDTVTNSCMRRSPNCPAWVEQPTAAAARSRLAETGASIGGALMVVEYLHQAEVKEALEHCAMYAEEKVNSRHFDGRSPTREQCMQAVGKDANGNTVTRAMQLGQEKHQVALECMQWRLELLMQGQFSVEPRYRYNSETKQKELLSPQEVLRLLESGRSAELIGTLVPDIVIHFGQPLSPKAVYEFKFPCPPTNRFQWRRYGKGHPYQDRSQLDMYKEALEVTPRAVTPIDGVI
jgi:hypothetical protein